MQLDDFIGLFLAATVFSFFLSILRILRFAAGVSWRLDFDPGPPLRKSCYGSGSVNSVNVSFGLQVVEHQQGWLIRMLPTYFFSVLWFPKDQTIVGEIEPATWISPRRRLLEIGADAVVLRGHLADFVTAAHKGKMDVESLPTKP